MMQQGHGDRHVNSAGSTTVYHSYTVGQNSLHPSCFGNNYVRLSSFLIVGCKQVPDQTKPGKNCHNLLTGHAKVSHACLQFSEKKLVNSHQYKPLKFLVVCS